MQYTAVFTVTAPATEPVTLDQVRAHLRLDTSDDDELLMTYAASAREWVEIYLNRALISQTLRLVVSQVVPRMPAPYLTIGAPLLVFPLWFNASLLNSGIIELPRSPVQSIESVNQGMWGQPDLSLVMGAGYNADVVNEPGRVMLTGTFSTPQDHVSIVYTAGYGDDAQSVPKPIILGVLWMTAWLYENRGDAAAEVPAGVARLLSPYRLISIG